tara:strand:- start:718 stop:1050 length:333 start_codon:yes stop_codon:yes gene_type:complete
MTQDKQKLDKILENLYTHEPSSDLAEHIMQRAAQTPQKKPFSAINHLTSWIEGLYSPWPSDLGLKASALACIALICFTSGLIQQESRASNLDNEEIATAIYMDYTQMELY